jgi:hypothetical protein
MGGGNSRPKGKDSPTNLSPTNQDIISSIRELHNNKMDINTTSVHDSELNRFRKALINDELTEKKNLTGGYGNFKPEFNKYQKYDITDYLSNIIDIKKRQDGGNGDNGEFVKNGFEELSDMAGIDELKKLVQSIEANVQDGGNGDNNGLESSPISEGIRDAFFNLSGAGFGDELESDNFSTPIFDELDRVEKVLVNKDDGFSETSAFSFNDSNSYYATESSIEHKSSNINALPFYTSESSSSFQHPYTKNRFA